MAKQKKEDPIIVERDYQLAHERGNFRENLGLRRIEVRPNSENARAPKAPERAVAKPDTSAPDSVDATDTARELAADHPELDLSSIEGTGSGGRILKSDVQAAVDQLGEE